MEIKNEGRLKAKARDEFFESDPKQLQVPVKKQYLKNRIEKAYCTGWDDRAECEEQAEYSISNVECLYMAFNNGLWRTGAYTREKDSYCGGKLWSLLITSGFKFKVDDLVRIEERCDKASWRCKPHWYEPGEGHYSLAVKWGNLSSAYAYEKLVGRKPFIGTGLSYPENPYVRGGTTSKTQGRLVDGCEFLWESENVKVTTFRDKENALIACAYHPRKDGYAPNKIKRRFMITHDMWQEQRRLENKVKKLESKGVFVEYQALFGYYIRVKGKKKTTYYDTTGIVEPSKDLKKYKPFKSLKKAYEAAAKLVENK